MLAEAFTGVCVVAVAGLLLAESRRHRLGRAIAKSVASLSFVAVAVSLGATNSTYGQWVLAALLCSVAGDLLLLSDRSAAFLAGLGAFLVAHAAYASAFALSGISGRAAAAAAGVALLCAAIVVRWLWPRLERSYRWPVGVYIAVILGMCCMALGHAAASGRWIAAIGAAIFAASDAAVAREKFVRRSFGNKAWGLPAYFGAQLLLAWSVP